MTISSQRLLNDNDIGKIGSLAKLRKFEYKTSNLIYPTTNTDKLRFFISSFRFLLTICAEIQEADIAIQNKILAYLNDNKEIYRQALILNNSLKIETNFGKRVIIRKLNEFILTNEMKINNCVDSIIPIGRVIKTFNPDETQGYY